MYNWSWKKHILKFNFSAGTSRGVLHEKPSYFLRIEKDGNLGVGECGLLPGLSIDNLDLYQLKLEELTATGNLKDIDQFPSIMMGVEMAKLNLQCAEEFNYFEDNSFRSGKPIPINGLVWMGEKSFMQGQIKSKIEQGFTCVKMKIGAINFDDELELLQSVRKSFSAEEIELRVDANGAFSPNSALEKLKRLAELNIHSIEQPIKPGQLHEMASLCEKSPLPIALDEEIVGFHRRDEKLRLLELIRPQYITLKPSLLGGFSEADEWIEIASGLNIGWWATSALESNVGLNAIAEWTSTHSTQMPQGLGTGSLYSNNIQSPLTVLEGALHYNTNLKWSFNLFS